MSHTAAHDATPDYRPEARRPTACPRRRVQADGDGHDAAEQQRQSWAGKRQPGVVARTDRVRADEPGHDRTDRDRQQQREAHRRQHEGEDPPAQTVLDLEADERVADDPGDAREEPYQPGQYVGQDEVADQRHDQQRQPGAADRHAEDPAARVAGQHPGTDQHAGRQTREQRPEHDRVTRCSRIEGVHPELGHADGEPAGRECADDADVEPADQRIAADVCDALPQQAPDALLLLALGRANGDRTAVDEDRARADEETDRIDHERDDDGVVDLVAVQVGVAARDQPVADREQSEQARSGERGAVDGEQRDLVRGGQQLLGHDRDLDDLLRRLAEQAGGLDDELRDVEPDQVVTDRDARVEDPGRGIGDDHRLAAVQLVGERGGERAEEQVRCQPDEDDAGDRDALGRLRAVMRQLLGQRGVRQQAEPVAEARERDRGPEPAHDRDSGQDQQRVLTPLALGYGRHPRRPRGFSRPGDTPESVGTGAARTVDYVADAKYLDVKIYCLDVKILGG